jgi:hypothetical protein
MNLAQIVVLAGVAVSFVGFVFFRQPGVPLLFFGPVWRASRYVTPTGARLWIAGSCLSLAGVVMMLSGWVRHVPA